MNVDGLCTALEEGQLVIIPTDTVYGLSAVASDPAACARLSEVKGRRADQPIAVVFGSLERLIEVVEPGDAVVCERLARLFPGPVTAVVPNPYRRFPWLCGETADRIGVRVPRLAEELAAVLDAVGGVAATSANRHGEAPAAALEDVDPRVAAACALVIEGGRLGGTPSSVIDLTTAEPTVLRPGPVDPG